MRLRIIFKLRTKGVALPFHHQYLLADFIRSMTVDYQVQENETVMYNFSGLKGQIKVSRNGLHYYSNRVTLVFSCTNVEFVNLFLKNIFQQQFIEIGSLILNPEYVEREQTPIFTQQARYVCISPLVLMHPEQFATAKDFIAPDADEFSDFLYNSTIQRMKKSGLFAVEDFEVFRDFEIIPDKLYLEKISREAKKFARIYHLHSTDETQLEMRGYTFPFALYAHPRVHEFVFFHGFGEVCNDGYGMIDLANADPLMRCLPYRFENKNKTEENLAAKSM